MKTFVRFFLLLFLFGCTGNDPVSFFKKGTWVDLTHEFDENTVYWPTNIPFRHDTVFYGMTDQGYFYSSFRYSAEEHGGTHFDAPFHFGKGKSSIEKVPLSQLVGEGIVIDVSEKALKDRDYQVSIKDFESWEKQNGKIPEQAMILIRTGYSQFWNDHLRYMGTVKKGAEGVAELHFPALHPDAAKWLATQRKINGIGVDTPGIDYGQSKDFMTHRTLFQHDLTAYENLTNLDKLPSRGFYVVALPMKIKGGSGAPLRIIAWIPDPNE